MAAILEASPYEVPDCPATSRFLCACYVQMGRLAEARPRESPNIRLGEARLKGGALIRGGAQHAVLFDGLKRATSERE